LLNNKRLAQISTFLWLIGLVAGTQTRWKHGHDNKDGRTQQPTTTTTINYDENDENYDDAERQTMPSADINIKLN
jgi:hypothetical protein